VHIGLDVCFALEIIYLKEAYGNNLADFSFMAGGLDPGVVINKT
jgi:hypothetical protein